FAVANEGMVVFRIADPQHFVPREPEAAQSGAQAGRLVDAGREHHDGGSIEDDLQLETELPHDVEDDAAMPIVSTDQYASRIDRLDAALAQFLGESLRYGRREQGLLAATRVVEHRTVLRNDQI